MPERDLRELVFRGDVQKLLDQFSSAFQVRMVFFGPEGQMLHSNHNSHNSAYCRTIQKSVFGRGRCVRMDRAKQNECLKSGKIVCYRCHAGLREAVAPVFVRNRLAGFVLIGQFRTSGKVPAAIFRRCSGRNIRSRIRGEFESLPFISPRRLDNVLGMFVMLVDYIVARELVGFRKDWKIERIEQHLDRKMTENVRLADLARLTGRSISGIGHLLKKKYGRSFKKILLEKRLAYADSLLNSRPELSIGEIAAMSGFEDRYYFSRIYRKYRGRTPSEARTG